MSSLNFFACLLGFTLLASPIGASGNQVKKVNLENGERLEIRNVLPFRILPHAFYDQAMASIPGVYPSSEIIAKRRIGYLRKDEPTLYAMVCYKESKEREEISISGIVTIGNDAWSFDAKVPDSLFGDTLILVLETLAELPFNKSLQPSEQT